MDRRTFLFASASLVSAPGLASAAEPVRLRDLYNKDLSFSDLARSMDGLTTEVDGFMAPPLKAESSFFVLTKMPMAVCPFCESEAQWPADIVAIYNRDIVIVAPFNVPIRVSGILRLGVYTDEELGFVSKVRLSEADYWRI